VIEELHSRLVTAKDVKGLDGYSHQQRMRDEKENAMEWRDIPVKRTLSS